MKNLIADYINYLRVNNKAKNTITSYQTDLLQLEDYLNANNTNVTEVGLQDLINFLAELDKRNIIKTKAPLAPTTKMRKIASIKDFFSYLFEVKEVIKENPALRLKPPKRPVRNPAYLSLDESIKLLNSVTGIHKARDLAILTIFLNCGLRVEEIVKIKISDIKGSILTVKGKGNKEREVPLNEMCITAINNYVDERELVDNDILFITERKSGFSVSGMQYLVKKYLKKAGIDVNKYSTHDLRHTAATLMHNNGVDIRDIQEILGHKDISTTQIYTHVNQKNKQNAVNNNPLNQLFLAK